MGKRGPPPKAPSLRVIDGTVRPLKVNPAAQEYPPLEELPDAPVWMTNPYAHAEWHRLGALLVANKLLTREGLNNFAALCSVFGELAATWARGDSPLPAALAQWRGLAGDFGLSPAAQSRIRGAASGQTAEGNKFAGNGKRRNA